MQQRLAVIGAAILVAMLMMLPLAHAQGITGTVTGSVTDSSGALIPGATVTLVSESKGLASPPSLTSERGDFVFPNVDADRYTLQVEMPSFKTAKRTGITVSPGSNVRIDAITLEVGAATETIQVSTDGPALLQTAGGEKSYSIEPAQANILPIENRNVLSLLSLAPGVNLVASAFASQIVTGTGGATAPTTRIGGGGGENYMIDGAVTMSAGVNRPSAAVSAEAISEVKVVTFGYGAEYGRAAGNQINAVTKSGTNQFHGSFYDFERHSRIGYSNSQTNILNGDPKAAGDQRDIGFTIGGPIGKPGGNNKLFFFWNQEYNPRTPPQAVTPYRMPTALERLGDFSQSTDNLGNPYPYIKDPLLSGACNATSQVACFKDGGVVGRIPANRIWKTGQNILNWWPSPNCPGPQCPNYPANAAYNYVTTYPKVSLLGWEPVAHIDYAPTSKLRGNFKYIAYLQGNGTIPGRIPGFSDSTQYNFGVFTYSGGANYSVNNTMFLEGNFSFQNHAQEGCSITGGDPNWCITGDAVNPSANRINAGFAGIPYLFPNATQLDQSTLAYRIMQNLGSKTSVWDGTRIQAAPSMSFGSRITNTPLVQNLPWSSFILEDRNRTMNFNLTKIWNAHTIKAGYSYLRLVQTRGTGAVTGNINFQNDTTNPLDTSFGFSNALLGIFSSYSQASTWQEGAYTGINHEFFIQDNWKATPKLTLDYGVRFVHQVPGFDGYNHFANFFPEKWSKSGAPRLYTYGCDVNASPCPSANRRAMDPGTGTFLGTSAQASIIVGTLVPGTGTTTQGAPTNGLVPAGTGGIGQYGYTYPALAATPRFGFAYSVNQRFVVRGSTGLFIDRPQLNSIYAIVGNPPFSQTVTVRYGNLQDISSAGLTTTSTPTLSVFQHDNKLPKSFQWTGGVQAKLPFSSTIDLTYTGQHSWNQQSNISNLGGNINLNSIDYGSAFLASLQDPTLANTGVTSSLVNTNPNAVRAFTGYSTITQTQPLSWETYHSFQVNFTRRLQKGISFGFNDTISLSDHQFVLPRLQHNADGSISIRSDQAQAQRLLGDNHPQRHVMRGNAIWQLPKLANSSGATRVLGYLANDWTLANVWQGSTGAAYSLGYTYLSNGANINITGSPDFAGRMIINGDPGTGCGRDNRLQAFNTAAFQGPLPGSVGLESGSNYLRGCFVQNDDLSLSRTIVVRERLRFVLRADVYNVFNWATPTGYNTTAQFASPAANTVITNLPFDAKGAVLPALSIPRGAGFGVANAYQNPRTMQIQLRFQF